MKTNIILNGDALEHLKNMEDECVDMVLTSPPYYALRNYGVDKQIGIEKTYEEYIDNLINIFDEVKRVLKKRGTLWIVIGDSYSGPMGKRAGWTDNKLAFDKQEAIDKGVVLTKEIKFEYSLPQKCLMMIPQRLSIRLAESGWILRNTIIWHKPNAMCSNVKDRFSVDFDFILFFAKNKKYYFNQQFEPVSESYSKDKRPPGIVRQKLYQKSSYNKSNDPNLKQFQYKPYSVQPRDKKIIEYRDLPNLEEFAGYINQKRKEKGLTIKQIEEELESQAPHHWFNAESFPSVYDYNKLKVFLELGDKYDAQMTKILKKSSAKRTYEQGRNMRTVWKINTKPRDFEGEHFAVYPEKLCETPIKAGCPEGGIVLDPFFGSGTTGVVALKLNRKFIGIELNRDYVEIANRRLKPYLEQKKLINI